MRSGKAALSSVLAPRDRAAEHLLVPAGRRALTREALEARCLPRLARLLERIAIRHGEDHGRHWKPGDFDILLVETTVAPDAVLYVQFWSEPGQPTLWEVCSGTPNPGARRFITARARRIIGEMGFAIGGQAGNFRKKVLVGNSGDALAGAGDVLRIFHEAFRYRGATPLVARVVEAERSGRAVVHDRFTPEDLVNILRHRGCVTELKKGRQRQPLVFVDAGGFRFVVALEVPADDGCFRCLDVTAMVGHVEGDTEAAWLTALNELNARSRVARAWVDADGDVLVGTSVMCTRGVTEDYVVEQIEAWLQSAQDLLNNRPAAAGQQEADDVADGEGAVDVAEGGRAPRRRRPTEVVH